MHKSNLLCTGSYLLQLKTYRIKSTKEPCIRVNTRELNRVSKYNVSYLYAGLLVYVTPNLAYSKEYVYYILLAYGILISKLKLKEKNNKVKKNRVSYSQL